MSKFALKIPKIMGWLAAIPLALVASGINPIAVQAKASDVSSPSPAIAASDPKIEGNKFSIAPQQYVATRSYYRYRPYYHGFRKPHKFYTYRYIYNPYTGRYEYRLVYFWR